MIHILLCCSRRVWIASWRKVSTRRGSPSTNTITDPVLSSVSTGFSWAAAEQQFKPIEICVYFHLHHIKRSFYENYRLQVPPHPRSDAPGAHCSCSTCRLVQSYMIFPSVFFYCFTAVTNMELSCHLSGVGIHLVDTAECVDSTKWRTFEEHHLMRDIGSYKWIGCLCDDCSTHLRTTKRLWALCWVGFYCDPCCIVFLGHQEQGPDGAAAPPSGHGSTMHKEASCFGWDYYVIPHFLSCICSGCWCFMMYTGLFKLFLTVTQKMTDKWSSLVEQYIIRVS